MSSDQFRRNLDNAFEFLVASLTDPQMLDLIPDETIDADQVAAFLQRVGFAPVTTKETTEHGATVVYVYVDGPRLPDSSVQVEWYLEFTFSPNSLLRLNVERRLVGP